MPDGKLKIYPATWENFGGKTPIPDINDFVRQNVEQTSWLNPPKKPVTIEEKFGKIPTPIQGFKEQENYSFKTPEDELRDAIKERELPFQQRASAKITDFLFKHNLNDRAGGDVIQEMGTPIVSGLMRSYESGQNNDMGGTALGLAGATFGTLMSPFTAIKMGTEKVAGETAGKVAELGSLAFTGGIPLVVGYFTSQGATELAKKVSEGLELTPKESETVQEVAGLTAFLLGDKTARSFGKKVNTALGNKVKSYINELPEGFSNNVFRKGEGEAVPQGTYKDLLKGQDQQRIINNPPEKRAYQEPTQVLDVPTKVITSEGTPSELIFNQKQIKERINEIDNEVRKAEKEGNEPLFNELQAEKKRWQDKLPEIKTEEPAPVEIIKPEEKPVSKREQQKQTLYDENKKVINKILDENKGLLTEREISAKLNAFVEQGKLKKKVSPESIKQIEKEWRDTQPKPEKQIIKSTPNELGLKIPNEYNDKTVFNYGKMVEKVKGLETFEQVQDAVINDWNAKSEGVLSGKKNQPENYELSEPLFAEPKNEIKVTDTISKETTPYAFGDESVRYIKRDKDGNIISAIDVLKNKKEILAIQTKEGFRDQGYAKELRQQAEKDLGKLTDSNDLSQSGQKFADATQTPKGEIKNQPAKDLLEKTTKEENFPDSMWDEIFGKPQTREQILKDLDQAKREGLGNVGSVLGAVNVDIIKGYAKLGALHVKEGARDFTTWSKKMVEDLGEDIRPYLRELYTGIQQNSKINDKPVLDWINKYKDNLGLELKPIEGKIIDPNTGQEGAARHKAGRDKSTIEFNSNTQGATWYHELAHVVNNKIRQIQPDFLKEFLPEIDKLVPASKNKPLNEKFADAFERIYTDPSAPRTRMANVLEKQFDDLPKSFELARRTNKELGFEKLPEREAGVREEKSLDWLEEKFDAPKETINEVESARNTELYKELRDDGTQTFQEAVTQSARLTGITEKKLLELDPKTLNNRVFNKAEQVKIDQIAINKALQVGELRKSFGDKLSTEQAKTLETEILNLIKLQALAKNNLREAARVMESARKRNKLTPDEYELIDGIAKEIDSANKKTNLAEQVKGIEKATDVSLKDKALYWWYNSILSNPLTDVANIVGNASNLGFEVLRQPSTIINGSLLRGIKAGWENASRVWKGEQRALSKFSDAKSQFQDVFKTKTKTGERIKNTLLPTSRLAIEDAFFRSIFETMREEKQAKLTAKELGVTSKEIIDIYTDILKTGESRHRLVTELGSERFAKEIDAVERYANKMVFQKELGVAGKKIQSALNQPVMLPVKLLALPFLRIAVNLTKVSAEASPLGLLRYLKRAEYKELTKLEKADIRNRIIAGTVFYTGLLSLLDAGKVEITGEAPEDKNIRDLWYKEGYEPFSVIINNSDGTKTVTPYQNVSPVNIVLGSLGTMITEAKYSKKDAEGLIALAGKGVLGFVKAIGNQSFLQGTSQLLNAIERTDEKILTRSLVRMTTPNLFSLFQGSADFGEGKDIYQVEGILDEYKSRIGFTSGLDPKTDVSGQPLKSNYRRFPIPRERETNKIASFLNRTGNTIGDPSNPKINGVEQFSDKQYSEYLKIYRQTLWSRLGATYDLLEKIEKQSGDIAPDIINKLISSLKEDSKNIAKQKLKEKQ